MASKHTIRELVLLFDKPVLKSAIVTIDSQVVKDDLGNDVEIPIVFSTFKHSCLASSQVYTQHSKHPVLIAREPSKQIRSWS